jgi:hypothetical protein
MRPRDDVHLCRPPSGSRWPPDQRADELRARLGELLTEATGTLADLRIAARRGRFAELPDLAEPLPKVAEELDAFAEAHG